MATFTKDGLRGDGFTGVQVWSDSVTDIFKATSVTESFLYISVLDTSELCIVFVCSLQEFSCYLPEGLWG